MTEISEGSIELHMKSEGIHYALCLRLDDFPTEEKLVRGLDTLNQCLKITLVRQGHWIKEGASES